MEGYKAMTTHLAESQGRTTLTIGGMTCASCAARVEKKLNGIEGVTASVNFATETADVRFPEGVTASDLVAAVEETGYTATLPEPDVPQAEPTHADETAPWRQRLLGSAVLTLPVVALSMVPALQFDN